MLGVLNIGFDLHWTCPILKLVYVGLAQYWNCSMLDLLNIGVGLCWTCSMLHLVYVGRFRNFCWFMLDILNFKVPPLYNETPCAITETNCVTL